MIPALNIRRRCRSRRRRKPHRVANLPSSARLKARGSYDDLNNTYEAITNYLDDQRLEAKDMFIEEYESDPAITDANKLVIHVYVLIKGGQPSPGCHRRSRCASAAL